MARIHQTVLVVDNAVIDENGHVSNLAYLSWMQDGATAHSSLRGWPIQRYRELGAGWFVRSHFIDYLRPAFCGDVLRLSTWVAEMSARSSIRKYAFVRQNDGVLVVRAETFWVYVDFASGKPVRISGEVASAFEIVTDDAADLVDGSVSLAFRCKLRPPA